MPWSEEFCWVDPREELPVITNSKGEQVPTSFFTFGARHILVKGKVARYSDEPASLCPRCCSKNDDIVEVSTTIGVCLYCFECKIFYPEHSHRRYD